MSTARRATLGGYRPRVPGYRTPVGSFKPTALVRYHRSTIYDGSPMPHSIFFLRGYAIHGSYEIKHLGQSQDCKGYRGCWLTGWLTLRQLELAHPFISSSIISPDLNQMATYCS